MAPADGVVTLAATTPFTLEGRLLIVDHRMGLNSAFLHCQSLDVKVGDRVVQGQRLGTVGRTGQIGRAHVCTPVTNAHLVSRLLLAKKIKLDTLYERETDRTATDDVTR